MPSEMTLDPDWQEINAVLMFVMVLKTRNRPIRSQDAHSLIVKYRDVKDFLKQRWRLCRLEGFFLKYPHYFKLSEDGEVYLSDPSLEDLELQCAFYFFDLLRNRNNRPIHVINAICFVSPSSLDEYLRSKFNTQDLTPFFKKHLDLFLVQDGYVSMQCCHHEADTLVEPKVDSHDKIHLSRQKSNISNGSVTGSILNNPPTSPQSKKCTSQVNGSVSTHNSTNCSSQNCSPVSLYETFRDVACQTVSCGPILSLNVFHEMSELS